MKSKKKHLRVLLLSALGLAIGVFCTVDRSEAFVSRPGQTYERQPGVEWVLTEEALARTLEGEFLRSEVCKELCYFGEPQGVFRCL